MTAPTLTTNGGDGDQPRPTITGTAAGSRQGVAVAPFALRLFGTPKVPATVIREFTNPSCEPRYGDGIMLDFMAAPGEMP